MHRLLLKCIGTREDAHDGGLVGFLYSAEDCGVHALKGSIHFIYYMVPRYLRKLVDWTQQACVYFIRVAVRLTRVAAVFSTLVAIVLGPLFLWPGVITGIWACLIASGSVWGLRRHLRKLQLKRSPAAPMATEYIRMT